MVIAQTLTCLLNYFSDKMSYNVDEKYTEFAFDVAWILTIYSRIL